MSTTTQSRRFHALAAAVFGLLLLAPTHPAAAREIKFPSKSPAISFEIPDSWKTQQKGGSTDALYCVPDDSSGLNVQFYNVANAEIGDDREKFAEMALQAGKVEDIKVVKSDEKSLKSGQTVKFVRSTFKRSDGIPFVSLIVFVPAATGRTCVAHCFLPVSKLEARQKEIEALLDSIKLLD